MKIIIKNYLNKKHIKITYLNIDMLFFLIVYILKNILYNKIKKERGEKYKLADLNKLMYKLQLALKQKGILVYINTSQFYSKEQDRFIKMYRIVQNKKEVINTASQIKAVSELNRIWQEVKNEEGNK